MSSETIFSYFTKDAAAKRELQKKRHAYIKERQKARERLNKEKRTLDKLLKEKSIDNHTYARYKKLLEMSYQMKREQTRGKYGFTRSLAPTGLWAMAI